MHEHGHLARTVWPAEDNGYDRSSACAGVHGPAARGGSLVAVRHDPVCIMTVHADGGRLLLLRARPGDGGASIVEEIDPVTLEARRSSGDLPLGPFWPGGIAALDDGGALVVQGRHAHRLDPDLAVVRTRSLPVDAPYNSFAMFGDATVATKDLRRPDEAASTLLLLDPDSLDDRGAPFELPEPSVARLSASGDLLVVVGVTALHRLRWDDASGRLEPLTPPLRYVTRPDQSFGWDPVISDRHIWWMDNGDHQFIRGMTMLGNGVAGGPVRLWRADIAGDAVASVEVCGRPAGAITNPPLIDVARRIAVAFDSANGVLAAFDADSLEVRWRIELATAQHLVLFPDTGEILANSFQPGRGDALAVVDIASGEVRFETPTESPAQSVVFCAPGRQRDAYYVSLTTVARVTFD